MGFDGVGIEDCGLLGVDVLGRMDEYEVEWLTHGMEYTAMTL
jgi:hypothetical protein